jgi:hypothetical protein
MFYQVLHSNSDNDAVILSGMVHAAGRSYLAFGHISVKLCIWQIRNIGKGLIYG